MLEEEDDVSLETKEGSDDFVEEVQLVVDKGQSQLRILAVQKFRTLQTLEVFLLTAYR
jgi:uncharacterized coiled-coil protein SlyX